MCQILQPDGKYLFVRCADYRQYYFSNLQKEDEFQHEEFIVNPCRVCSKQIGEDMLNTVKNNDNLTF